MRNNIIVKDICFSKNNAVKNCFCGILVKARKKENKCICVFMMDMIQYFTKTKKRRMITMKFLKSTIAVVLSLGMVLGLAGCGTKEEPPAPEQPAQNEQQPEGEAAQNTGTKPGAGKKFTIATDTTFAPFEFENEQGEYVGIDIDLIKAIAEDQGFEIDLQSLGFNAAVQALESGQCDGVIAGMSITPERQERYDFSNPYYDSGVVMGIAEDNTEIKGYEDLKGQKVAVKVGTEGSTFAESIMEQYGFELVYFDDSNSMYQDVKSKNAIACFEDYPVLLYGINNGIGLKVVTDMEKGNSYGFAVKKGEDQDLLQMFNDGYKNVVDSGKYQEILDTYIKK